MKLLSNIDWRWCLCGILAVFVCTPTAPAQSTFGDSSGISAGSGMGRLLRPRFLRRERRQEQKRQRNAAGNPAELLVQLFNDDSWLDVVRSFDRLEFYILPKPDKSSNDYNAPKRLLATSSAGEIPSPEQARRVAEILSSAGTYSWGVQYMCGTLYGVRFDFHKGDKSVSILLCLNCAEAGVVTNPGDLKQMRSEHIELKKVFPELLSIIKELAPNNAVIQGLKPPSSG